ncbi:MAG: hypothetical protein KAI66_17865, partial [Lentisphaeria bacterium]|nr:hypothetical protein [Lentisphaeria bacterium]
MQLEERGPPSLDAAARAHNGRDAYLHSRPRKTNQPEGKTMELDRISTCTYAVRERDLDYTFGLMADT